MHAPSAGAAIQLQYAPKTKEMVSQSICLEVPEAERLAPQAWTVTRRTILKWRDSISITIVILHSPTIPPPPPLDIEIVVSVKYLPAEFMLYCLSVYSFLDRHPCLLKHNLRFQPAWALS